jgi:hypothetical protein
MPNPHPCEKPDPIRIKVKSRIRLRISRKPGAAEAHLGTFEAHKEAFEPHNGAVEAHPGAVWGLYAIQICITFMRILICIKSLIQIRIVVEAGSGSVSEYWGFSTLNWPMHWAYQLVSPVHSTLDQCIYQLFIFLLVHQSDLD